MLGDYDYSVDVKSTSRVSDEKSTTYVFDFVFAGLPDKPKSRVSRLHVNLNGYPSEIIDELSVLRDNVELCGVDRNFHDIPVFFSVSGNDVHVQFRVKLNQVNDNIDMRLSFSAKRS